MKTRSLFLIFIISLSFCSCENPLMKSILQSRTITFESNGGSHVPTQTLLKDERISEPRDPTKAGCFFGGWWWYTDNGYYIKWDFNDIPYDDMTLYAVWDEKPTPTERDFYIGAKDFEYDGSPKAVTITPKEGKTGGKITIYYEGTEDTEYDRTQDPPTSPGKYKVTFDVAAAEGWNAAIGLSAGILIINVSTRINQTPIPSDFNIGGALTFTYDGLSKTVSIEPKKGKSQGTVTVYYNGNTAPPASIGTYTITFDVAPAEGWNAANGLSAGTLTIIAVNPNYQTPALGDFTISGIGTFVYDGSARPVTVTAKTGKTRGTVVVKYNGSITAPTDAATYAVTFDVSVADGWNSASGLSAGTITISKATPGAGDFYVSGTGTFNYDGNAKTVTISPKSGKSQGTITVNYNDSSIAPTNVGTYLVTFDVANSTNWNEVDGLSAGLLTINKGTPVAADFTFYNLNQEITYPNNNNVHDVNVTPNDGNYLRVITVYYQGTNGTSYNKSINKPLMIGSFTVTFDVTESPDGNWNAAYGLLAGTLKINVIETIADLKRWLDAQFDNFDDPDKPAYPIALNVNELGGSFDTQGSVGSVLRSQLNRYVSLDLSGSTFVIIDDYAFRECENLISVKIPSSVKDIGESAFQDCSNLASLIIGNNVKTIGKGAFFDCGNLTSITIPNSVTYIGDNAFQYSGLTSVRFEEGVNNITYFGDYAFPGNLHEAYFGTNGATGGAGTYTRGIGDSTWTRTN